MATRGSAQAGKFFASHLVDAAAVLVDGCPRCGSDQLNKSETKSGKGGGVQKLQCGACNYAFLTRLQDDIDFPGRAAQATPRAS